MSQTTKKFVSGAAAVSLLATVAVAGFVPTASAASSDPADLVTKAQSDTASSIAAYESIRNNDNVGGTLLTPQQLAQSTPPAYNAQTELSAADRTKAITATNAMRQLAGLDPVKLLAADNPAWEDTQLGAFALVKEGRLSHGMAGFKWYTAAGSRATNNSVLSQNMANNPDHIRSLINDEGNYTLGHRLQMLAINWFNTAVGASRNDSFSMLDMITLSGIKDANGTEPEGYKADNIRNYNPKQLAKRENGTSDTAWPSSYLPFPYQLVPTTAWSYMNPMVFFEEKPQLRVYQNGKVETGDQISLDTIDSRPLFYGHTVTTEENGGTTVSSVLDNYNPAIRFNPSGSNNRVAAHDYRLYLVKIDGGTKLAPNKIFPEFLISKDANDNTPFSTQYLVRMVDPTNATTAPVANNIQVTYPQNLPGEVNLFSGAQTVKYQVKGTNSDVASGAEYVLQLQSQAPGATEWKNVGDPAIYRGVHEGSFNVPANTAPGTKYRVVATDYNGEIPSATATVVKKQPEITKVAPLKDITVASGTQPQLPTQVDVTYSDGSTGKANVNWNALPNTWKDRNGGDFTVQGDVAGTTLKASQKVIVTKATITQVTQPVAVTVVQGETATLPATVKATWSNGDTTDEAVTWPPVNTDKVGDQTVTATKKVGNQAVTIKVTVIAAKITGVTNPDAVTTPSGTAPSLPATVKASFDNGKTGDVPVTWEASDAYKNRKGGSYELKGTVAGWDGTQPTIKVNVTAATVTEIAPLDPVTVTQGMTPSMPAKVKATWSNGDTTDEAVTWPPVNTDNIGAQTVTATTEVGGKDVTVVVKVIAPKITAVTDPAEVTTPSGTAPTLPGKVSVKYNNGTTGEVAVTWEDSDAYKNRAGGSYELKGTVEGWEGTQPTIKVNVTPAKITKVEQPEDVTVTQGTKASLPATVKATWSNGDTTDEAVTWPEVNTDKVGEQTVKAENQVGGQEVTIKVNVVAATVTSIDPLQPVTTKVDVAPKLPATVKVHWSNGTTTNEPVTWPEVDVTKPGEQTVTATSKVGGKDVTIKVVVEAAKITKVTNPDAVTTDSGTAPTLPDTVKAEFDNGTTKDVPVKWDASDAYKNRAGGSYELKGTVEGWNGTAPVIKVNVNPATVTKVEQPADVTVPQGVKPELPKTLKVTWSNGDITDEPVTWPEVKTDTVGQQDVTGKVAGQDVTIKVNVTEATVKSIKPLADQSVIVFEPLQLPEKAEVTWSNGKVTTEPITWPAVDTTKVGTQTVTGKVAGQDIKVKVTVTGVSATVLDKDGKKPVTQVHPGDQVTIVGKGFADGAVAFSLHSDPIDLGSADSKDKVVTLKATIPADAALGDHQVVLTQDKREAKAALKVVAKENKPNTKPGTKPDTKPGTSGKDGNAASKPAKTGNNGLAATGSSALVLAIAAGLAIIAGATVTLSRRRPQE